MGFGGYTWPPGSTKNETEEWNGTSWAEQDNLNTQRHTHDGAGTQTAALCVSGGDNGEDERVTLVEAYDGSSWTEVGDVNTARGRRGAGGGVSAASAIFAGGHAGSASALAEQYDGSTWTEVGDLSAARWWTCGAGTGGTSSLVAGGYSGSAELNTTEVFTEALAAVTFTSS